MPEIWWRRAATAARSPRSASGDRSGSAGAACWPVGPPPRRARPQPRASGQAPGGQLVLADRRYSPYSSSASCRESSFDSYALTRLPARMLHPDIRGAVAAGIAHLMRTRRTVRLLREVHEEALIDGHSPVHRVAIDLYDGGPGARHVGIKLVIPGTQERVG